MTISDQPKSIEYIAAGDVTDFTIPWTVTADDQLVVLVNGVVQILGAAYTVPNVGAPLTTVRFAAAPTGTVFVYLDAPMTQATVFSPGPIRTVALQTAFDEAAVRDRSLEYALEHTLRVPATEDGGTALTLPEVSGRADKLLGFDATGGVLLYDPATTGGGGGGGGIFTNLVAGGAALIAGIGNYLGIGSSGGSGGVTVHAALQGLTSDDHLQYLTDARGDARYARLGHEHIGSEVTFTGTVGNAAVFNAQGKLVDGGIAPGGSGGGDMVRNVYDPDLNGIIGIEQGGTAANTRTAARASLGLAIGVDVAAQSHQHILGGLADVSIMSPSYGEVLSYDGQHWVNTSAGGVPSGSGAVLATWSASSNVYTTLTARTPMDNTIPQLTETAEFLALALVVTPTRPDTVIEVSFHGAIDAANECVSASCIFVDTNAQAAFAIARKQKYTGEPITGDFTAEFPSGSTTPRTYHFRFGTSTGTSLRFNGYGSALFGGVAKTLVTAREVVRS